MLMANCTETGTVSQVDAKRKALQARNQASSTATDTKRLASSVRWTSWRSTSTRQSFHPNGKIKAAASPMQQARSRNASDAARSSRLAVT